LYDFHYKDFDFKNITSSPPPTLKIFRDAEEKSLRRLMELESEKSLSLIKIPKRTRKRKMVNM
jgi:hypothetical protein